MKYKNIAISTLKYIPDIELKMDKDNYTTAMQLNISPKKVKEFREELQIIEAEIAKRPILKANEAFE